LRSENTILQVVSGIGIQRTFWPRTYVLFWWGMAHFKWLHKQPK
jgi:hypothetical protein